MLIPALGGVPVQAVGASLCSVDTGCPSNEVLIANWSVTLWDALASRPRFNSIHANVGVYQEAGQPDFSERSSH